MTSLTYVDELDAVSGHGSQRQVGILKVLMLVDWLLEHPPHAPSL